jgi:hypothetical protein
VLLLDAVSARIRQALGGLRLHLQVPRLFGIYRKLDLLQNFQQMIDNIFKPLFAVSSSALVQYFSACARFQSFQPAAVTE